MKLVIDARPLTRNASGIHRYLKNILDHLAENNQIQIILYADRSSEAIDVYTTKSNVTARTLTNKYFRFSQWLFYSSYWLRLDKPDCYWSPRHDLPMIIPSKCRAVVTVHDMVWKTVPKTMPFMKFIKERVLMPLAIKKANAVLTISDSTKNLIGNHFPKQAYKVQLIKIVSFIDSRITENELQYKVKPLFLAVGTLEPRKNYVTLLKAFDEYIKQGGNNSLLIVGRKGWKYNEIFQTLNDLDHQDRVIINDGVDDEDLLKLYKTAQGFISVSLDEGFGLPAAEAQSCGLPMLLSDIPVYRELFTETKLWTSPLDQHQMTGSLLKLETLPLNLTNKCNNKENWSDVADQTLQALQFNVIN